MSAFPDKIRITHFGWSEDRGAYKVQLGTADVTVAYAWVAGGVGDRTAHETAMQIAERICEGWNA